MEVLSIYMVLGGINHWPGVVYKAVGRPDILNKLSFLKLVMLVPVLWWAAANYGILGVAWGQLVVRIVGIFLDMWTVARFVHIGIMSNLRVIWPPLAAAVAMAALVRVVLLVDPSQSSAAVAVLAALVGAASYLTAMWALDRPALHALIEVARSLTGRKRPATVEL
jgi:hypothetical protein